MPDKLSLPELLVLLAVIVACMLALAWLMRATIEDHNRKVTPPVEQRTPDRPRPMRSPSVKPPKVKLVWRSIYSDEKIRRMHWGDQQEASYGRSV